MDYNDSYGYSYDKPKPSQSAKQSTGCLGCCGIGCMVAIVAVSLIMIALGVCFVLSMNRAIDYVAENDASIESQFQEHEDDVEDMFEFAEGFMNGMRDAVNEIEDNSLQ